MRLRGTPSCDEGVAVLIILKQNAHPPLMAGQSEMESRSRTRTGRFGGAG
mgnify:CR=1 FL=1